MVLAIQVKLNKNYIVTTCTCILKERNVVKVCWQKYDIYILKLSKERACVDVVYKYYVTI